jgi:hypothetical protein
MSGPDLPRRPDGFVAMDALRDAPMTPEAEQFLRHALHRTEPDIDDAVWRMLTERATDPSTPPVGPELIEGRPDAVDPLRDTPENHIDEQDEHARFDLSTDPMDDWLAHPHGFDGSIDPPVVDDSGDDRALWYRDPIDDPEFDDPAAQ